MKKQAFTLMETLITIGIIGVVAAIAVPSLMKAKPDQDRMEVIRLVEKFESYTSEALQTPVFNSNNTICNNNQNFCSCNNIREIMNNDTNQKGLRAQDNVSMSLACNTSNGTLTIVTSKNHTYKFTVNTHGQITSQTQGPISDILQDRSKFYNN